MKTDRLEVHAHKLVAELCEKMAQEIFETCAKDNEWYRVLRASNPGVSERSLRLRFVRWMAPRLVGDARATLAGMLPTVQDKSLQNAIYEALLADNVLRRGRGSHMQRLGWYKRLMRQN